MPSRLGRAIEALLESGESSNMENSEELMRELRQAYDAVEIGKTDTQRRLDYLQTCLENGMSKRDAARSLSEHDPRVGRSTAETLVYTMFSGRYQKSRRGRKIATTKTFKVNAPAYIPPASSDDDEGLL